MGQLIVTEFVTLDGIAQAPGGPEEDIDGAFEFGGWQAPLIEEESGPVMFDKAKGMDALLLGRRTYDIFADYWPSAPEEIPFTGLLNGVPKYVASRTLTGALPWNASTVLQGDLVPARDGDQGPPRRRARHRQPRPGAVAARCRAGRPVGARIYPVVLGKGKRVFEPGTVPTAFRVAESVTYPRGTVNLVLTTDGAPTVGDMTVD